MFRKLLVYSILLATGVLVACGSDEPNIEVSDVWGRPSPQMAANAAFYMTIENRGGQDDRLVAAEIAICGTAELHESVVDANNVMSMQHVDKIDVPAGETVKLEVGGLHVMCLNRQGDLEAGGLIPITLTFEKSGVVEVEAEIRQP